MSTSGSSSPATAPLHQSRNDDGASVASKHASRPPFTTPPASTATIPAQNVQATIATTNSNQPFLAGIQQYGAQPQAQQMLPPQSHAQQARPIAPRVEPYSHGQRQTQPQPQSQPQATVQTYSPQAPMVFYPRHAGEPMLMQQCPRCGLRAGEPLAPINRPPPPPPPQQHFTPNKPPLPQQTPGPHLFSPNVTSNQTIPAPQDRSMRGNLGGTHTWPAGHPYQPNAHLGIGPPFGYQASNSNPASTAEQTPPASKPTSVPLVPIRPPSIEAGEKVIGFLRQGGELPRDDPALQRDIHSLSKPDEYLVRNADGTLRSRKRKNLTDRPYKRRLTEHERRDILLMRRLGYKMEDIAKFLGTTIAAVHYTTRVGAEVKHKNAGRKIKIPEENLSELLTYVEGYLAKERSAENQGFDKRTQRRKVTPLTYKMIRDACFKDEKGEPIQALMKISDDGLKGILNRHGLWLRMPMSQNRIEEARARGKRQWLEKLEMDKQEAAEKTAEARANDREVEEDEGEDPGASAEGYAEAAHDEEMEDVGSGTESVPDDDEDDGEHARVDDDVRMRAQLRTAIQP